MTTHVTEPLLSVIIPNHNYGQFIAKAIECVSRQDYAPIELIVVDDGSGDDSVAVIEEAIATADIFRAELIALEKNVGKLGAINRGLKEVKGYFSIILDSDDYLLDNYVNRCVTRLVEAREEDPEIGFIYTDCNLIAANGEALERGRSAAFDPGLLEQYSYIPEPAVTVTKALVDAAPFDESIRKGTKHHKWRRIVANGWRGVHLAEPLFCYRMHDSNLSGIGKRITSEVDSGRRGERILSGYWPTAVAGAASGSS